MALNIHFRFLNNFHPSFWRALGLLYSFDRSARLNIVEESFTESAEERKLSLVPFIVRRLFLLLPVLIGISLIVFSFTTSFNPRQRAMLYLRNNEPAPWETEIWDRIIIKYKLNSSWYDQYSSWAGNVLSGNLGWSRLVGQPVLSAILERFPITCELVLLSAPVIVIFGIWLGVQAAIHHDTPKDYAARTIAVAGWSVPAFLLGILLVSAFYVQLGWLPRGGRLGWNVEKFVNSASFNRYTRSNVVDGILNGQLWVTADALLHLLQPVAVVIVVNIALIIRVMRASMLEVLGKNYIISARAKGLNEKVVINKHARRNALIPTITIAGMLMNTMLTSVVVTETVFSVQGLGKFATQATVMIDVPAVAGLALVSALFFALTNLIVDILYVYIDPRIEYTRKRNRPLFSF